MLGGYNCVAFVNLKTQKILYLQLDLGRSTDKTFFRYMEFLLFFSWGPDKPKEALSVCTKELPSELDKNTVSKD